MNRERKPAANMRLGVMAADPTQHQLLFRYCAAYPGDIIN